MIYYDFLKEEQYLPEYNSLYDILQQHYEFNFQLAS